MIKEPLVSIIVPLYNKEKYLPVCLDSIKKQTYKKLEIIIINDGSSDNSLHIAEAASKDDERFKVFSKVNGGSASARKLGIQKASGAYILTCDADDQLPCEAIELLVIRAISTDAGIVVGDILKKSPNSEELLKHDTDYDYLGLLRATLKGEYHSSTCNKLIKKVFCKEAFYVDGVNYMEDKLFLTNVLVSSKPKIEYIHEVTYIYNFEEASYTNLITTTSVENSIYVSDKLSEMLKDLISDDLIKYSINYNKLFVVLSSNISQNNRKPETLENIHTDSNFGIHHRLILWSVKHDLNLPIKLYKLSQKMIRKLLSMN